MEAGHYIDTDTLEELARSLGTNVEHFVKKKKEKPIQKITYKSASAYVGCSHCQFLSKRDCLNDIFPRPRDWAVKYTDKEFDKMKLATPVNEGWLYSKDKHSIKLFASYDKDEDGITFGDRTMIPTPWVKKVTKLS